MNKLFQIMTAALLGLALIVPAAAQDGQSPKGERGRNGKRTGDIVKEPKRGEQPRGRGNDNRGNADGRNGGGDRGKGKGKGNRPNDDLHYDL